MKKLSKQKAFTVLELLIVVGIIGILTAVSYPAFSSYMYRASLAEATGYLAQASQQQISTYAAKGLYANGLAGRGVTLDFRAHSSKFDVLAGRDLGADGGAGYASQLSQLNHAPDYQVNTNMFGPLQWSSGPMADKDKGYDFLVGVQGDVRGKVDGETRDMFVLATNRTRQIFVLCEDGTATGAYDTFKANSTSLSYIPGASNVGATGLLALLGSALESTGLGAVTGSLPDLDCQYEITGGGWGR